MISNELQYRVHLGDSEAFKALFSACGRDVYLAALDALGSVPEAREAVKRVFLQLQSELTGAPGPIDIDARIAALTKDELLSRAARQAASHEEIRPLTWEECRAFAAPPEDAQPTLSAPAAPQPEPPCAAPDCSPAHPADSECLPTDPQPQPPAPEPPPPPRRKKGRVGVALLWCAVILLTLLLVWFLLDVLMTLGLVPRVDLGYSWFNTHVYPLFRLQ